MFALADISFYVAVLSHLGKDALVVTTNMSINFFRKPDPRDLISQARILKSGNSLIVGDVMLLSDHMTRRVAHATCTYSRPPKK